MMWKQSNYEAHPAGVFKAKLVDYKEIPPFKEGDDPGVRLYFETNKKDKQGNKRKVSCATSQTLGKKGRVHKMCMALGFDTTKCDPKTFDLDTFKNKPLQLVVENETKDDGSLADKITTFLSMDEDDEQASAAPPEPEREAVGAAAGAAGAKRKWDDDDE